MGSRVFSHARSAAELCDEQEKLIKACAPVETSGATPRNKGVFAMLARQMQGSLFKLKPRSTYARESGNVWVG